jgi:hypothetical protein
MVTEVAQWLARILAVLPELIGLYEAVKVRDPRGELDAQLALMRAMKDQQMKEELPDLSSPKLDDP